MLTAEALEIIARRLRITQLVGGETAPWVPNVEQLRIWAAGETHQRRFVTKPRRVGASTALDLEDALWTLYKDATGHRVRAAIVLPVESTAKERIKQCASFLSQLDADHRPSALSIDFPNGSQIVAVTAGSESADRGEGYQRCRWEEFAFYDPEAHGKIAPSVGIGAPEIICTTIDIAGRNGLAARDLWRGKNDFKKLFFPFELHGAYRADSVTTAALSDTDWAWCLEQGFTNKAAAAYWMTEVLQNKCNGDVTRAMREYPQIEAHMFAASEGRVVKVTPEIAEVVHQIEVPGVGGDVWRLDVYRKPEDTSGQIVGAVDTSQGIGESRSAVCFTDKLDGRIVAAFAHAFCRHDDLARIAQAGQQFFKPAKPRWRGFPMREPVTLIEKNGIGQATITEAERLGMPHEPVDATHDWIERVITEASRALEAGQTSGPMELAEECDELVRDERGKYVGRKDVLITYGMCLVKRKQDPYVAPPNDAERENRVEFQRALSEYQRSQGGGLKRPRWGV